ncbi:MAG: HAD-IB family hydrolase [Actinomycetia bacterium]|nr:HAD-IB family hydrolase [Actinomycetes bacterium]
MAEAAAFFDLDRTLLLGGSGPTISAGLRDHGLLPTDRLQIGRLMFGLFDLIGETLPSIALTRQGARAAKGWVQADVKAVGEEIASSLVDQVEPYALQSLADHRALGHKLVLATTTPFDVIAPFAADVGFDEVLATRYRVVDGRYAGEIDGEFVWNRGKARSVRVWARANKVDLADSYAYSDSIFDRPLLTLVGHPVAVNPDPRLFVYARAKGWPTVWFNAPPGVPKPTGVEPQDVLAQLLRPELFPWMKLDIDGIDGAGPALGSGGTLLASNHRSYLDPIVVGLLGARIGRPVRFLAKKEVTDAAIVGPITTALGAIRVDRGSGSAAPLTQAAAALDAGELVAVFPQGTIPRGEDFFRSSLQGRLGAARLAIETGVPLTPVGLWGTELAWPRSSRLPYVLNLANPAPIRVRVGASYYPSSTDPTEVTEELMGRITDLLPPEARQDYEPSPEELALTFPPGASAEQ